MQGEAWSPNGEARELIVSLGLHHTSMSIGDVVQDDDSAYWMCAHLGWQRLPDILTPEQREGLLAALSDEIEHLCERGVPFTGTDLTIGERLIAWRDAVEKGDSTTSIHESTVRDVAATSRRATFSGQHSC